jgi:hypothetical protein
MFFFGLKEHVLVQIWGSSIIPHVWLAKLEKQILCESKQKWKPSHA